VRADHDAVLVVNAGSTSLKLNLVDRDERVRELAELGEAREAPVGAVAHRVVHGGPEFTRPAVIGAEVIGRIRELVAIAPLHNAPALDGIEAAQETLPDVPHVAVFDTAFHSTIPEAASTYAVPREWREQFGIRRFGFHGLSVAWCAQRAPELLHRPPAPMALVVCHLGGGCSLTAVRDGRSVDTTMGFTPMEGVPMVTRSGSIDPGAMLHLQTRHGLSAAQLEEAMNRRSGVAGLSARPTMIDAERAAAAGDERADLALRVFCHRVAGAVAAMAVAAGGLDVVAFTAGIGENSARVRRDVCELLSPFGVRLDPQRNADAVADADLAADDSPVRVLVVHAREELVAARAARELLAADG
jgi:acetate kinase